MAAKGEEKLRAAAAVAMPTAERAEGTTRRLMARAANIRVSQSVRTEVNCEERAEKELLRLSESDGSTRKRETEG